MKLISGTARSAIVALIGVSMFALHLMASVSAQVQTNEFKPLSQVQQQPEFSPAPLLYGAYAFVWGAVIVYVFTLWRRLGRVERELNDVTVKLSAKR